MLHIHFGPFLRKQKLRKCREVCHTQSTTERYMQMPQMCINYHKFDLRLPFHKISIQYICRYMNMFDKVDVCIIFHSVPSFLIYRSPSSSIVFHVCFIRFSSFFPCSFLCHMFLCFAIFFHSFWKMFHKSSTVFPLFLHTFSIFPTGFPQFVDDFCIGFHSFPISFHHRCPLFCPTKTIGFP